MTVPLTCTTNTLCHVDYNIPISIYKSTDYRTCTGTYHRFMPPLPQDFDATSAVVRKNYFFDSGLEPRPWRCSRCRRFVTTCMGHLQGFFFCCWNCYTATGCSCSVERVKVHINNERFKAEPKQKEEQYKSVYTVEYPEKQGDGDPSGYVPRPVPSSNVNYLRIVQEKMFKAPPPPIAAGISESKSQYYQKESQAENRVAFPPNNFASCEIKALGRDEQPAIRPELKGCYRLMDPYMTTSRITHLPFTVEQQDGIARKDIITFYDASGFPRGGKGYGPRNCTAVQPIFPTQIGEMSDRIVFKTKVYNKILPKFMKRIPNYGMQSEYQGKYTMQTYYDSYPTIYATLEEYDESLPMAGPWQNLVPPGMYCTDYCHIGTGWPVRSVIEPKKPEKIIERNVDLCRPDEYVMVNDCISNEA